MRDPVFIQKKAKARLVWNGNLAIGIDLQDIKQHLIARRCGKAARRIMGKLEPAAIR